MSDTIAPGDNYPVAILLTEQPDPTIPSGPASGRLDVYGYLSATQNGDAIAPALQLNAAESGTVTTSGIISAKYLMEFAGSDTLALLAPFIGKQIWFRPFAGTQPLKPWPIVVTDAP